ncbi:MAG: 50S ribosomal protein L28 [Candidatus Colwellbacteria bacterium]|nr:50S ribosomal protein L28 [Candidatus Colwellbacteria bacterium]
MKICEICGKRSMMVGHRVKLRGHYNPTGKKRKYPNLQKTITPEGKKILACTSCIKRLSQVSSI